MPQSGLHPDDETTLVDEDLIDIVDGDQEQIASQPGRARSLTHGVSCVTASHMCSYSAWLRENAVLGSASGSSVTRTRHLAQKPVAAKVAEPCAPPSATAVGRRRRREPCRPVAAITLLAISGRSPAPGFPTRSSGQWKKRRHASPCVVELIECSLEAQSGLTRAR